MKGTSLKKYSKGMHVDLFNHLIQAFTNHNYSDQLCKNSNDILLDNSNSSNSNSLFKRLIHLLCIKNYSKAMMQNMNYKEEYYYHLSHKHYDDEENFSMSVSLKEAREVINQLPDDLKIPYSMYISGFQHIEIANKLSLPIPIIKNRIKVAYQTLIAY